MLNLPGHFGHIKLPFPIYHPSHMKFVKEILEKVCLNCLEIKSKKVCMWNWFELGLEFTFYKLLLAINLNVQSWILLVRKYLVNFLARKLLSILLQEKNRSQVIASQSLKVSKISNAALSLVCFLNVTL